MVTEDYVSFETAKLLKEKGFKGKVSAYYHIKDKKVWSVNVYAYSTSRGVSSYLYIQAPTLQMTMKWLREVYGICIELLFHPNKEDWGWYFQILVIDNIKKCFCSYGPSKTYSSYEEACEAVIKYCLENLI